MEVEMRVRTQLEECSNTRCFYVHNETCYVTTLSERRLNEGILQLVPSAEIIPLIRYMIHFSRHLRFKDVITASEN